MIRKIDALGVVSPHAGYIYSGAVAEAVFSAIKPKPTYIVLGTNHTGLGKPFGLDTGEVPVDKELAKAIMEGSDYIEEDHLCHEYEHSIKAQLPFLQKAAFAFVPIIISHADKSTYEKIGKELARAAGKNITVIASSDMTHYEPHEAAKKKDMAAIEKILALDTGGFLETVEKYNISMCGAAPTAVMMEYAIARGAKSAKLIKYQTSGETSGDYSAVVGYAGIVVY